MGLNISINRTEELTRGEIRVLEVFKKVYSGVEHEVYIFSECYFR